MTRAVSMRAMMVNVTALVALILSAFAHDAGSPTSGLDERAYAAQYRLPDGTLPVLCHTTDGDHQHEIIPCEFCLIAGSFMLADPAACAEPTFPIVLALAPIGDQSAHRSRRLYRLHAPLRAPPKEAA